MEELVIDIQFSFTYYAYRKDVVEIVCGLCIINSSKKKRFPGPMTIVADKTKGN